MLSLLSSSTKPMLLGAVIAALPSMGAADLTVTFYEGAPKDRFKFENTGDCPIADARITLDLSTSSAGLIFDVTGQGAGVEVFQPLEFIEGQDALTSTPAVADGQSSLELNISTLAPGATIQFTIDIDDTKGQRAITVARTEIQGAQVRYDASGQSESSAFSRAATAVLALSDCATDS